MILENSRRISINRIRDIVFEGDPELVMEGSIYPGDMGKVFDLTMQISDRPVRILMFDTIYGRKELLSGRFTYGRKARCLYHNTCVTVAKTLLTHFPEVMGYVERAREHQILRAGRVMTLAPFVEGLHTQGDDFKRKPAADGNLYTAAASGPINWGPETTRIFSDICPASGSTMEAFVIKALQETDLKKIIFNCSTTAINALYRVIPAIPENVEVILITWEALFNVYRKDITIPGGETIFGGTVINLNPDPDFPQFNPIAPEEVIDHIHHMFQREKLPLLPDIPGEVGEKIQDSWIGPLSYDFLELTGAGLDLGAEPWLAKAKKAWEMPGVQENIRVKAPKIYEKIRNLLGKNPRQRMIREALMI